MVQGIVRRNPNGRRASQLSIGRQLHGLFAMTMTRMWGVDLGNRHFRRLVAVIR